MAGREHWEQVWGSRLATEVSWYAPHLADSLRLIREVAGPEASILDVGGGASTLADDLLQDGYRQVTVLDVAEGALQQARARLGERADEVNWLHADVTSAILPAAAYDVWHDRAVFHFLTAAADRRAYLRALQAALKPDAHVVIGTFALDGPERCSGLEVARYDSAALARELGPQFTLTAAERPVHVTPGGKPQQFELCRFRRQAGTG